MARTSRRRPRQWLLCGVFVLFTTFIPKVFGQTAEPPEQAQRRSSLTTGRVTSSAIDATANPNHQQELKFANGLLRERKFDLAAEEFEHVLEAGAQSRDRADAYYGLASARLYQGRYPDARKAYEQFLTVAPQDSRATTARYRLGELAYLSGDLDAAQRSLDAFTRSVTNHPALETAWTYLGDSRFGLKDYAGARSAYQMSLKAYPRGRMADRSQFGLGRSLAALDDPEHARPLLKSVAEKSQAEWVDRAWLELGSLELAAGRPNEALAAFAAFDRAAPKSLLRPIANLRRAQALVQLNRKTEAEAVLKTLASTDSEPPAARAALELATLELDGNRPESALITLDRALKRFPKSSQCPALLFRSAEALLKCHRTVDAEARFSQIVQQYPTDPWADDALFRITGLAFERRDPSTALERAQDFLKRFPGSLLRAEVRLIESRALVAKGRTNEAIIVLEPLINQGERMPDGSFQPLSASRATEGLYQLALMYRTAGRTAEANQILGKLAASSSGSMSADAQFLLGQDYVADSQFAKAIPLLEHYLEANPQGEVADVALANLSAAQAGAGHMDAARLALSQLVARYPASHVLPTARLRLAEAELAAHRPGQAASLFRSVASSAQTVSKSNSGSEDHLPEVSLKQRAFAGLGKALTTDGKPAEAATAFASAFELATDDKSRADLAILQARSLEDSGQAKAALEVYESATRRFPALQQGQITALAGARLFIKLGKHREAAARYAQLDKMLQAKPASAAAVISRDKLLAEWGWALVDAEQPAEADKVFQRLLSEFPESPLAADARFNLAESANLAGNFSEVIRLLRPLTTRPTTVGRAPSPSESPTQKEPPALLAPAAITESSVAAGGVTNDSTERLMPAVLYRLGRTHIELKDWPAAAQVLDRLLEEFANSPYRRQAQALRAEVALKQGNVESAETLFAALLAEPASANDPPEFSKTLELERIQCWVALKRWKDVIASTAKRKASAAAGDPTVAELDYARGQALLGQGDLVEARSAFQQVIDARKTGELAAQAQLMRGETFYHQEQFREALREFLKVQILYDVPKWQAAALLEAGKVYERLDQWPDAAETYQKLISKFPGEPAASAARERYAAAAKRASKTPVESTDGKAIPGPGSSEQPN